MTETKPKKKIWRRIPVAGKIIEIINKDPYKMRLKNMLRRMAVNGTAAAALLSGGLAVIGAGALSLAGEAWDDIDNYIDGLDEKTAKRLYLAIGGWNLA